VCQGATVDINLFGPAYAASAAAAGVTGGSGLFNTGVNGPGELLNPNATDGNYQWHSGSGTSAYVWRNTKNPGWRPAIDSPPDSATWIAASKASSNGNNPGSTTPLTLFPVTTTFTLPSIPVELTPNLGVWYVVLQGRLWADDWLLDESSTGGHHQIELLQGNHVLTGTPLATASVNPYAPLSSMASIDYDSGLFTLRAALQPGTYTIRFNVWNETATSAMFVQWSNARFSNTPEPFSLVLMGTAGAALAFFVRRRRKSAECK
jgi:hypothetical protein